MQLAVRVKAGLRPDVELGHQMVGAGSVGRSFQQAQHSLRTIGDDPTDRWDVQIWLNARFVGRIQNPPAHRLDSFANHWPSESRDAAKLLEVFR